MPVLFNPQTGLVEDLDQQQADEALKLGGYKIPIISPTGQPGSVKIDEAPTLIQQGYRQPTTEELSKMLDHAKYSSTEQQLKTLAEGAASAATFGLSTGVETELLGVDPKDIRRRGEVNPGVKTIGELGGLGLSALVPGGAANILEKTGAAGARALGLGAEGAGILSKVGSAGAKGLIENSLFSAGNEVSKMFAQDPHQTLETALLDIGISGLVGGAITAPFGAVAPMWKAVREGPTAKMLSLIKDKANAVGPEAADIAAKIGLTEVDDMAAKAGIALAPELRAGLSKEPLAKEFFATLAESGTGKGQAIRETMKEFREIKAPDAILESLGKNRESIDAIRNMSDAEMGTKAKDILHSQLKKQFEPLSEEFEKFKNIAKDVELNAADKAAMNQRFAEIAEKEGMLVDPGAEGRKYIDRAVKIVENSKNLEDLRKASSSVLGDTYNAKLFRLGGQMKNVFRDTEEKIIGESVAQTGNPDLFTNFQKVRAEWSKANDLLDSLNDRLHLGRYKNVPDFLHKLADYAKPEQLLNRLSPKNDATTLQFLKENFPDIANIVKENYLSDALWKASKSAKGDAPINVNALYKAIEEWSPELKEFALPPGSLEKIDAVKGLLEALPERMNPSGTGRALDTMGSKALTGLGALAGFMSGHGFLGTLLHTAEGVVGGHIGQKVAREIPDAIRMSLLKFLGSDQPINAGAFKVMTDFIAATIRGESKLNKAVEGAFKVGTVGVPSLMTEKAVSERERRKLKETVDHVSVNPESLMNVGGETAHYLPDEAVAATTTSARVTQYLASLKPSTAPQGILDSKQVPSKAAEARFNNALDIALNPLLVLGKLKNGNITINDIKDLNAMYPNIYAKMRDKMFNQIIELKTKEKEIPYQLRMNLSMFLGQPLDSTMTPQAVMAAQSIMFGANAGAQGGMPKAGGHHSYKELGKLPNLFATPQQARMMKQGGK